jgi:hypothetical protein
MKSTLPDDCPFFVVRHSLPTPLYQICRRDTGKPVNVLFFYARREDAEGKILEAVRGGAE